ncbi:MAG: TonB-dependent receptor [Cellvibrionales bacterium]|nr:TonB-dependent receptor [Cellvibrionales bacterium]
MKQSCITIKLPLFLAMAVSMAAPVIADDGTTESIGDNNVMDTVVVTASRTEQILSDTLDTTTVISRDDIERIQPRDLTDLLRRKSALITHAVAARALTAVCLCAARTPTRSLFWSMVHA